MMHIHHIIPKHMGGTDDPENLIECSIEEHAQHHKELWEKHGHEWDRIAWLSLSGQVSVSDARRLAQLEGAKRGGSISAAIRKEKGNDIGTWNRITGNVKTIATKEGMAKGGSIVGKMLVEDGRWEKIRSLGSVAGGKATMSKLNSTKWRCVECGMVSTTGGIGNHQRGSGHKEKELVCQS
jgi:hypothetical protein